MPSDLLTRVKSADAPDDALTETQAHELRKGVEAAIEHSDQKRLGLPSHHLTNSKWDHAGVGVSVWIHRKSGVVILKKGDSTLVTDVDTLDHMSLAQSRFHATTGGITRVNDDSPEVSDQ